MDTSHVIRTTILIGCFIILTNGNQLTTISSQKSQVIDPGSDFVLKCRFLATDVTSSITWLRDRERLKNDGNYGVFFDVDLPQIGLKILVNSDNDVIEISNSNFNFKSYETGYFRDPDSDDVISYVSIRNATAQDGGSYICSTLTENGKRKTGNVTIIVKAEILSIRNTPDQNVTSGDNIVIPCSLLGDDDYQTLTWYFASFSDNKDLSWSPVLPNNRISINDQHEINIHDITTTYSGFYKCEVRDFSGNIISKISSVKVQELPQIESLVITPQKPDVRGYVLMTCTLGRSEPKSKIFWMKNGIKIYENSASITTMGDIISLLQIKNAKIEDSGNYSCVASNNAGTTMETALLLVHETPYIVNSSENNVIVVESRDTALNCVIKGSPLPVITWSRILPDNSIISLEKGIYVSNDNMTSNSSVKLFNVTKHDAGVYICAGKNDAGDVTQRMTLEVNAPAKITDIIPSSEIYADRDVKLFCTASGDGELNITWFHEDKNLNLNKNNLSIKQNIYRSVGKRGMELKSYLTISNVEKSNEGSYSCVVYNEYGEDQKSTKLTVIEKPLPPKKVEINERGVNFLQLSIHPPLSNGGLPVNAYVIKYSKITFSSIRQDVMVKEIAIPPFGKDNKTFSITATIDDLECGSEYEFNVSSFTLVGESSSSYQVIGRTIGEAPLLTSMKDFIVEINQTSVVVDLNAWFDGGCEIEDISLEFSSNELKINNSEFTGLTILDYRQIQTISNLKPGAWYKIKSTACNVVGCEEIIHSIPTLQIDGTEISSPFIIPDKAKKEDFSLGWRYILPMVLGVLLILILGFLLVYYHCKQNIKKHRRIKEAERVASYLLEKSECERKSRDQTSTMPSMKSRDTASRDASYLAYSINEFDDDVFLPLNENRKTSEEEKGDTNTLPFSTTFSDCDEEVKKVFESNNNTETKEEVKPPLPPRNRPIESSYSQAKNNFQNTSNDVNFNQTSTPQPGTSHQPWHLTKNGTPYDVIKILKPDRVFQNRGEHSSTAREANFKPIKNVVGNTQDSNQQKGMHSLTHYPLYHSKSKLRRSVFDSMPHIRDNKGQRSRAHSDETLLNGDQSKKFAGTSEPTKLSTRNDSGCFTVMEPESWDSIRKHFGENNQPVGETRGVPILFPRHTVKTNLSSSSNSSNQALSLNLKQAPPLNNESMERKPKLNENFVLQASRSSSVFLTPPDSSPEEKYLLKPPEIIPRKKFLQKEHQRRNLIHKTDHSSVSSDLSNVSGVSYTLV